MLYNLSRPLDCSHVFRKYWIKSRSLIRYIQSYSIYTYNDCLKLAVYVNSHALHWKIHIIIHITCSCSFLSGHAKSVLAKRLGTNTNSYFHLGYIYTKTFYVWIVESTTYIKRLEVNHQENKDQKTVKQIKLPSGLNQKNESKNKTSEVSLERRSLPEGIKIVETLLMGVSHYGVFCSEQPIKKGTRFGPFTGRSIPPKDIFTLSDTAYTWEVSKVFNDKACGRWNWTTIHCQWKRKTLFDFVLVTI